ncbi:MAG: dTDP-4-dehydrorhamnose 3,5-epimerase [Gaiellaceae bacterium]
MARRRARRGRTLIVRAGSLDGFHVIEPERHLDERGSFERMYCRRDYAEHGIDFEPVQISVSANARRGTLRGLHFQAEPHAEAKVVSCTRGSAFDVAVDLRRSSPTYGRWESVELSRENGRGVYVPAGCAHGFQTLEDDTELLYLISEFYDPELQRGVRWDDPALDIEWPGEPAVMSERDRDFPDFQW